MSRLRACAALLVLAACGDGAATVDAAMHDAAAVDGAVPDAGPCAPDLAAPECDNCIDDDGDGFVDGWDEECTGFFDDDEGSFDFGIPDLCEGSGASQDCFFDGNSGAGDDGCISHVCCTLDECPPPYDTDFDPAQCGVSDACRAFCTPLVRPGCDCFGCCTIRDGATCRDVYTNVCLAPDCDSSNQTACPSCTKRSDCGPIAGPSCVVSADCAAGQWCAAGTCIEVVQ